MGVETIVALVLSAIGVLLAPVVSWVFLQIIALGKDRAVLESQVTTLKEEQHQLRASMSTHTGESAAFQTELRNMISEWRTEMRDGIAGLNTRIAVIESHMNSTGGKGL